MVDSGDDKAFSLPHALVGRLGLANNTVQVPDITATFNGPTSRRAVRLHDSIFLGPYEFLSPIVYIDAGEQRIGHQALKHFAVTIDTKNKQIRFARADRAPIGPPPSLRHRGFYFQRRPDFWSVTGPIETVDLRQLGLQVGDRLIAVNGAAISTLSSENMQHLLDTNDTLHLDITRDGQKMSVNVPVTVIVR